MSNKKIDINEINRIPKDEFSKMLNSWMENEGVKKSIEGELRQSLIKKFIDGTALGKKMDQIGKKKKSFDPKNTVLTSMEAEHLYCNKLFFSLSVFSTENQQTIPDFECDNFRFEKKEIQEFLQVLGLMKDDVIVKHIINTYKSHESESLLSILIKALITSHKKSSVESKTTSTQTDDNVKMENEQVMDISQISQRSKTRKKGKSKNHSLVNSAAGAQHFKGSMRKSTKSKGMALIAHSLDLMSQNINVITNKLEDYHKTPSHDDSKSIILETVGMIMHQLNGCVKNFERLCGDIKAINDDKLTKNYDEWMDDLKHSENGKKFLKKFSKSFTKILDEERSKIKKEYQLKFEKDKRKLTKFYQASSRFKEKIFVPPAESKLTKDINEIYESTVLRLKNIEHENAIFEKSLKLDINAALQRKEDLKPEITQRRKVDDLDLNKCRQIRSKESSSINTNPHSYSSASFEDIISETNI